MKTHNFYKIRPDLTILAILLILLGAGCVPQGNNLVSSTVNKTLQVPVSETSSTATPMLAHTIPPTLEANSTPTNPPTPKSTEALTLTPSPTATFAWTPVPTLAPDAALEALLQLYNNNGGCELPCWWGITPGKTTWAEARTKLAPLGWMDGPWGEEETKRYDFSFAVPEQLAPWEYFEPHLGVKNGIVMGISVNSHWVTPDFDYSLSGLLQVFGPPDEIWLEVVTDTPYDPYYDIDLFYAVKGMRLRASGIIQAQNNHFTICPQEFKFDSYPPTLSLWDSSARIKHQDISYSTMGSKTVDSPDFRLLEELSSDFGRMDFYQTYLDPKATPCFEIVPVATTE